MKRLLRPSCKSEKADVRHVYRVPRESDGTEWEGQVSVLHEPAVCSLDPTLRASVTRVYRKYAISCKHSDAYRHGSNTNFSILTQQGQSVYASLLIKRHMLCRHQRHRQLLFIGLTTLHCFGLGHAIRWKSKLTTHLHLVYHLSYKA